VGITELVDTVGRGAGEQNESASGWGESGEERPLLAQSGREAMSAWCPLSVAKRTWHGP